jgi:hypothetical protein
MSPFMTRGLFTLVLGFATVAVVTEGDAPRLELETADFPQLFAELTRRSDAVRRACRMELVRRRHESLRKIREGIGQQPLVVQRELVMVLEEFLIQHDSELAREAEDQLLKLRESPSLELSILVSQLLSQYEQTRHIRALTSLEELGASLQVVEASAFAETPSTDFLVIDEHWKGGDDGISQASRLVRPTILHIAAESGISRESIRQAVANNPSVRVRHPDHGCLGVAGHRKGGMFEISFVVPNSPAEEAGLRVNDRIRRVHGMLTNDSSDISEQISAFPPRSVVTLDVMRGRAWLGIDVALGSDFAIGSCRCAESE